MSRFPPNFELFGQRGKRLRFPVTIFPFSLGTPVKAMKLRKTTMTNADDRSSRFDRLMARRAKKRL